MIDQSIKKAMNKLDATGCLVQWTIELSQFNIEYRPRLTIKAQVLAEFIVEFTFSGDDQTQFWTIHADGSSIKELGDLGVILISLDKDVLKYGVQLQFPTTNNEAKYEAILTNLRLAKTPGVKSLVVKSDSKLIIMQVNHE